MEKKLRNLLDGGVFTNVPRDRARLMSSVKGRNNASTELRFRLALVRTGLRGWTLHGRVLRASPDFYFTEHRIAVFVDGCFWHGCPDCGHLPKTNSEFWKAKIESTRQRDLNQALELQSHGIQVIRFWEHQLEQNLFCCVSVVRDVVNHGSSPSRSIGSQNV